MNLLIIGNGFDLAHGLKTNYNDFLQWAYDSCEMETFPYTDSRGKLKFFNLPEHWRALDNEEARMLYQRACTEDDNFPPRFVDVLFKRVNTWIDLENNIAQIIEDNSATWQRNKVDPLFTEIFEKFLVLKLGKYISEIINSVEIVQVFHIEGVDRVLSFNYSNTFERLYDTKAEICYINGKAVANAKQSNIVFGCDCYDYSQIELTRFNKIAQRTSIGISGKYRQWLSDMDSIGHRIFVVGHSLGKTDWHIIRPFITSKNCETTVYYHSDKSKEELIHQTFGMVGDQFMIQHGIQFTNTLDLKIERTPVATVIKLQR